MREQHQPPTTDQHTQLTPPGEAAHPLTRRVSGPRRRRQTVSVAAIVGALAVTATACASSDSSGAASTEADYAAATSGVGSDVGSSAESEASEMTVAAAAPPATAAGDVMSDEAMSVEATAASAAANTIAGDAESEFADATEPRIERDDSFAGANFIDYGQRPFVDPTVDPLSTFSLDVDHGSYTVTRAALDYGQLPPPEAIRPEEFVNSFRYDYPTPDSGLAITVDGARSPFTNDDDTVLMRVGVGSETISEDDRPPVALTFVVDTSGSMEEPGRLPMVKYSLRTLVGSLQPDDTVAIVTYSDDAGVVLAPTPISESSDIERAIDRLQTSGSTNLEAGLETGYELAREAFRPDGINGVILASDGIANVGSTSPEAVLNRVDDYAEEGISLVTLGYGMQGYNDVMMEQLANDGDGFYAYIDSEREVRRLFEDELTSTLVTVAKNSKIQVEFNPDLVAEYRLIGYENRAVLDSDFRNDAVDAGELGAGHEATAIYEVRFVDDSTTASDSTIASVHLRWESPTTGEVTETDRDVIAAELSRSFDDADDSLRLAVAVAGFAERLRFNGFDSDTDLDDLAEIADDRGETDLADQMRAADRLIDEYSR